MNGRNGKPFIPAWLDDAGLSPAEMRVFVHLLRSADNRTGIAWPSYRRITEITGLSRATVERSIKELKRLRFVQTLGKPFGGSNRYRILPMVSPEGTLEASNSITTEHIEAAPIVSPEGHNVLSGDASIVSPESKEGYPRKGIQRRVPNNKAADLPLPFSSDAFQEAWTEWQLHRKQIRKPLTDLAARKTLKELATVTEAQAIEAINRSIKAGWQGVFVNSATGKPAAAAPKLNLGNRAGKEETL